MGIIQRQGIQNTVITYLGILIGFANLMIQPFLLSKDEVGLVRVLFAFSTVVAAVIPLGITSITIKYFPVFRNKDKGHHGFLGFIILFPLAGGLVIFFLLSMLKTAIIGQYVEHSKLFTDYFHYVLPMSIILGFITVLNTYCFSLFKTTIPSLLNDVVIRLMTIAIIYVYFLQMITLEWLVISYVGIYALQLGMLITYMYSVDKPTLIMNKEFWKDQRVNTMLRYGFLLSFAGIASLGIKYLDSIMIAKYMPIEFVGIYSIVVFIPTVIEAPLNSLDRIAYTKIGNALSTNNYTEIKEIYYKSSRYLFAIGGALFLAVNLNIADLLSLLPPGYEKGINVVLIISLGALINMAGGTNTSIIFNSRFYKIGGWLLISLAVMAFLLNMLLIPRFGLDGSAAATAITVITFAMSRYLIIYKGFKLQPYDSNMLKITVLIILGMLLHYILPLGSSAIVNIVYRSVIILSFYVAGIYYLNIVPELHEILRSIGRRLSGLK